MPPSAPASIPIGMAAIAVAVALLAVVGCARAWRSAGRAWSPRAAVVAAAVLAAWMTAGWLLAASGLLADWQRRPPPFALLVLATLALSFGVALSPLGRRLADGVPLAWLIGAQAFRLPLELVMAAAAGAGVMPVQMSFHGRNLDVLTGLSAAVLAPLVARGLAGRRAALAWNAVGALLLANIVAVAIASTPPVAAFGAAPERLNTWVAHAPYVWLPQVLVAAAIVGHVVVARALRRR